MDFFNRKRRQSSVVNIGNTPLGGDWPIRIQSMASVSTMDTDAAVKQAIRLVNAGAEYVRFTTQGEREAQNLHHISECLKRQGYDVPIVADVHFNPKAADVAAMYANKVRINPGNYADKVRKFDKTVCSDEEYDRELQKIRERFVPFIRLCRAHSVAIRIGVNHGSLSERIMNRYGDTPQGMVESCMEFLRLCREERFDNAVISMKASNTAVMIRAVRLLVRTMEAEDMRYPLHLGVTEAGDGEDGRIKSAVGIGALLADGIGDTIRVSLSEQPEYEIPVARRLINCFAAANSHPPIAAIACPLFDPVSPVKRKSRTVNGIGGDCPPAVVSVRLNGDMVIDGDFAPDWIYTTPDNIKSTDDRTKFIVDAQQWNPRLNAYPCFSAGAISDWAAHPANVKFIRLMYDDLTDETIRLLQTDPSAVVMLESKHDNNIGEMRAFMHRLLNAGCDAPVILCRTYNNSMDAEDVPIRAAVDFGTLLVDGFGDGVMTAIVEDELPVRHDSLMPPVCAAGDLDRYMFGVLQAARVRISKTEYISCPGCGRTLFDLQNTIAQVKAATSGRKDLKIAVMGCIVNGPGEMADADYGYVGAGYGRISLYKGKECVRKNIPESEAVDRLLELISKNEQNTANNE